MHNFLIWALADSCHVRDCNALLVMGQFRVSGAMPSVQTFTF